MDLEPGTILAGKYRCERDLGAGGMGRVVAATHLGLRQPVALKVLTRTTSPDAARRLLREARLVFALTSPHVPKVLDAGQLDDGVPYIAMELLEGIDLAKLAEERGALPVEEACEYVLQACAGIGEAHALGIVHRDVKLANLFLANTPRGPVVKVLDFGCAKAERTGATSIANPTAEGAWLGTPRSMAPEQLVSSRDVDARADVWGLGVALYTLLAGRPPFDGKTLRVLYRQIQEEPPPPIARPLPSGLDAVIERCLRKNPEERFADARALAVALGPFARTHAAPRGRYVAILAVALAAAAVGASVVLITALRERPRRPSPRVAETIPTASETLPTARATADVSSSPTADVSSTPTVASVVASARPAPPQAKRVAPLVELEHAMPFGTTDEQANALAASFCARTRIAQCLRDDPQKCISDVARQIRLCSRFSDRLGCLTILVAGRDTSKTKPCTELQ